MSILVYQAINAAAAELSDTGIAKAHTSEEGGYRYRSIDDVMKALAPLLARHKLCILPRVLERVDRARAGLTHVSVRAAFDFVCALDGSSHTVEAFGEAMDESDKATAKATSAAYKSAMLQAFCIPVPQEEADASSPRLPQRVSVPEPPCGWRGWVQETTAVLNTCESPEAIERLCESRRRMLVALQRSEPVLYREVGETIAARLLHLQQPKKTTAEPRRRGTQARNTGDADAPGETTEAA
jgi:hypothetical protein